MEISRELTGGAPVPSSYIQNTAGNVEPLLSKHFHYVLAVADSLICHRLQGDQLELPLER